MTVEELIAKLPSDTAASVKKAKDRANLYLRRAIREEGGLTLSDHGGEDVSIPIRIDVAFPKGIEKRQLPADEWMAFLIAPYRPVLEQLRNSSLSAKEEILQALARDPRADALVTEAHDPLLETHNFAEKLLKTLDRFDLVKWLYEINEHILGCYDSRNGEVFLYWGVIGLVARQIAVSTEDLAIVVLGHELAHAYTHVGADIEGHRWPTGLFNTAEAALIEGLAQHFTLQICRRIEKNFPGAEPAFQKLLPHQPPQYHAHAKWNSYKAEEVRLALIRTRRNIEPQTAAHFAELLRQAKWELRGSQPDATQQGLFRSYSGS